MQTLGGLGLFLLGMIIMTAALQSLAGDVIRKGLMRFTKSPLSGAITGAVGTTILQSSSATTVAAVGFVGAGLMTFPEALGIIFGANIGTTIKGWMVAIFGFKFPLGTVVLPLIFIGAVLKLFAKGKLANIGYAMAGFSLVFVAITIMQQAMEGMEGIITPASLPEDTFLGRLQLVGLGIIATLITQSSSAGVAATLTLLYAGAINFPQAATLVVGMDIGTTVTAAMATIGSTTAAKRTGYSHVMYNCFTAAGALILITPFMHIYEFILPGQLQANGEIALVAFHTLFNVLGVIIILPFTAKFAKLMTNLVPDKGPALTGKLDPMLLEQPGLALTAIQNATKKEFLALLFHIKAVLGAVDEGRSADLTQLQSALDETQVYIDAIHLEATDTPHWERLVALIHTLDHLQRLHERCEEEEDRAITARETKQLREQRDLLVGCVNETIKAIDESDWTAAANISHKTERLIHGMVSPYRQKITSAIAAGKLDVREGTDCLQAVRWLRRVSKHIARIVAHYQESVLASGK